MAEKLDPRQVVTFEELLRAMMFETEATRRILVRKGLLTNEEVLEEIKAVRRKMAGKRVPMNSRVVEILKTLPRTSPHVFPPEKYRRVGQGFPTIVRKAAIQDFHFHDLRHTFASRLAMAGVDMLTIKELGGWKTLGMVIRYTHLSPDHKRAAVERLISGRTGTRTSTEENAELAAVDNLLKINSLG